MNSLRQVRSTQNLFGIKMKMKMTQTALILILLLGGVLLIGCVAAPAPDSLPGLTDTPTRPTPSFVLPPSSTVSPSPSASPSPVGPLPTNTLAPGLPVCSPLQDIALDQISQIISNPYHPPRPGSDDPHQGVDLADRLPDSQVTVAGRAVQAVLAGQVAVVIRDRFPYGSAILIETPLDEAGTGWQNQVGIPTMAPTLALVSALTCPPAPEPFTNPTRRSLYLLYAHLQQPPTLQVGDAMTCGQTIGAIGSSGNALNPHLHVEVRVGPAGLRLASMAHYDASATSEEMSSYCLWRISGWFQLVDSLQVLQAGLK